MQTYTTEVTLYCLYNQTLLSHMTVQSPLSEEMYRPESSGISSADDGRRQVGEYVGGGNGHAHRLDRRRPCWRRVRRHAIIEDGYRWRMRGRHLTGAGRRKVRSQLEPFGDSQIVGLSFGGTHDGVKTRNDTRAVDGRTWQWLHFDVMRLEVGVVAGGDRAAQK